MFVGFMTQLHMGLFDGRKINANAIRSCVRLALQIMLVLAPECITLAQSPPFNQCPAEYLSPSCAVLLVINSDGTGTALADSSVMPYDGTEDTLVGVQNNSNLTITSITLSGTNIFGFDALTDPNEPLLCQIGVGNCVTGYEGPGVSFQYDPNNPNTGTVLFNPGIPPGGSAWFGLEGLPSTVGTLQITIPPNLSITPQVSGTTTTISPTILTQTVTLMNSGSGTSFGASIQGLAGTPGGGAPFSIQPTSGFIGPNATTTLQVSLNTQELPPGTYSAIYQVNAINPAVTAPAGIGSLTRHAVSGAGSSGTTATGQVDDIIAAVLGSTVSALTFSLTGSTAVHQSVSVNELAGNSVSINGTYSGTGGAKLTLNPSSPTTPLTIDVAAAIGTMAPGGQSSGSVSLTCGGGVQCENAPYNIPVIVNAPGSIVTTQVFPHFADGGEWQTEFLLINLNPTQVTAEMRFHPDSPATTLNIQGVGQVTSISGIKIPPNGSVFYRTVGDPSTGTVAGWVEIVTPLSLSGTALFRRHVQSDGAYYEGSIPLDTPSTTFTIPFDGTTFDPSHVTVTALAIANPDPNSDAQVTCSAYDLGGRSLVSNLQIADVPSFGHQSLLLQSTPTLKDDIGNGRGILSCSSTADIGVLGLRFLGTAALSSLPVITSASPFASSQVFPHFADGGEWQTEFLLINLNPTQVTAEMRFHLDSPGTTLNIQNVAPVASISNIILPPNGSAFYRTVGDPSAGTVVGWAEVLSPVPLNGTALFRRHVQPSGKYYEGSIPLTTPSGSFTVPYDGSTFDPSHVTVTALAIANPNSSGDAQTTCSAYDLDAGLLQQNLQIADVPSFGHQALLLQSTPTLENAIGSGRGILVCNSTVTIGVLGLRFLGTAALSSLPVF